MAAREPVRFWILATLMAAFCALLPVPAWILEHFYSRQFFPALQGVVTAGSNAVPFAVLDAIIGLVVLLGLYRLLRLTFVARERGLLAACSEAARRAVRLAAVLIALFFVLWGFNYRRMPLETSIAGAGGEPPGVERLTVAFDDANALAGRLRRTVQAGAGLAFEDVSTSLGDPMAAALAQLGRAPLRVPSRPKHSVFVQPFFARAGFDGMINPLALETIVHRDLLPFERPFVLAHEWAHLAGHADEAEASAVGWLACMKGGPEFAYSASLYLIMQTQAMMPAGARQKALERLHPGVREDLLAIATRLESGDPRVQEAAERVYHEYLRANRVADGTASYSRALNLILSKAFHDALRAYR